MAEPARDVADCLSAARAGSRAALGAALEACRPYLLQIARQELDPGLQAKGSASDLVEETFVEALQDFPRFRGSTPAELRAWLRQLLLHRLAKFRRRYRATKKRGVAREVALGAGDSSSEQREVSAGGPSPSGQAMEHEQDEALRKALGRLPEDYRRVIALRYQEGRSFEEIGRLLQRSPEAARKLWARAVERLQQELEAPP